MFLAFIWINLLLKLIMFRHLRHVQDYHRTEFNMARNSLLQDIRARPAGGDI